MHDEEGLSCRPKSVIVHEGMPISLRTSLVLAGLALGAACGPPENAGVDSRAVSEHQPLLARSAALWPTVDCVATVRVCWAPPILQTTFPVSSLAPDVANAIATHKQWVQSIVESQWNALTPVHFVGWNDCVSGSADVALTPIDSAVAASCANGTKGQSCAQYLGQELAGGHTVYINMLFGDEVLYSSRYEQANPGQQYVSNDDLGYWWIPQACFDAFRYPWSTNNTLTQHAVDVNQPAVMAQFNQIYESCLQFNALHEFGHAAGFAHELQRADAPKSPPNNGVACQIPGPVDVQFVADTPLGSYDPQSIMNYCRTDDTATLSGEDVQETNAVYCPGGRGSPEGGTPADAGVKSADGSVADASAFDSGGSALDAGASDAARGASASAEDGGTSRESPDSGEAEVLPLPFGERRSSGCAVSRGTSRSRDEIGGLLAILGLASMRRRRRWRSGRSLRRH